MSPELFSRLEELATARIVHAAGSHLFHKGAPVRCVFAVQSGNVLVIRRSADGDELVLQRAGAKSVVSEASVHSRIYHCDAVALEDTTALSIRITDFFRQISTYPEFGMLWLEHLSREVQRSRARAEMLAIRSLA
ncbi:MAG TPA: Crp/Fnr family transcriptional regulator, partial [Rhizobiaceae bacterium]|nr:Crp/Fnr family transcriptional regulator [Rhizobiaceae bacterium]